MLLIYTECFSPFFIYKLTLFIVLLYLHVYLHHYDSVDIDECSSEKYPCDSNANCTNNDGSFSCSCQRGYTGNGLSCEGKGIIVGQYESLDIANCKYFISRMQCGVMQYIKNIYTDKANACNY